MTTNQPGASVLGAAVRRAEDPRFVRGEGRYLDDLHVEGEVWMVPVRSQLPHASIGEIDPGEPAPGVIGVFTAADLPGRMPIDFAGQPEATRLPLVSADRVRFVGDIVAVVVAETRLQAVEAAERVWVDLEPLPAMTSPDAAVGEDAPILFPEHGSNIVASGQNDTSGVLDGADLVVRATITHQRLAAVPLETNNALAVPEGEGVVVTIGAQQVHAARNAISTALGIDRHLIRVTVTDVGGGFGAKIFTYREHALCAALAMRLGRPVRWSEGRVENMIAMTHGRAQVHRVEAGFSRHGSITGLRLDVTQDCGGYPLYGAHMPIFTGRMSSGPYAIPAIAFSWRSVVTTTTPVHAYRGAGRPEATLTLERLMDLAAAELGIDPVEIRRRNLQAPEAFPWVTASGERYDSGEYRAALDLALSKIDYPGLRREQAERRARRDRWQLGIGVACYVEVTAPGGRKDWGKVEVHADGTATVSSGAVSHGHGHETTFPQMVSAVLGIPLEQVRFVQGDTALVVRGGGTMGSRSLQMAGSAVYRSAGMVLDEGRRIVAREMEAALEDVTLLPDGRIGVRGVPGSGLGWGEIAAIASNPDGPAGGGGLAAADTYTQENASVPFGAHISVVEVDTETGEVRPRQHVACDDAGVIVNRMVLDGQVHGGIAQGIGQVLSEQVRYDADANPLTTNLTAYLIPSAVTLPAFQVDHTVTPSPENPLGVKGIGEAGTVGATPAVYGAVLDALSHLGVRHVDMPLTPWRVWQALAEA
jgi:carbon-monoxide dehydrogenase large subunit